MSSANVHSIEAIDAVRRAMQLFDEQVADALTELGAEMRRMLDWLEHDRPRHWRTQVRKAHDEVHEAQQALHRCLMFPIADERPSCYEERMDLKKAQARLVYCQEKEQRVRHWQRTVQHELFEYEGRISQLVRLVEVDMPQSIAVLTKIVRHIEDYQSLSAGSPGASYDSVALVQDLWPEGEVAASPVENGDDQATGNESSKTAGIETTSQSDATV
jgi:hypothetical protein